MEDEQGNGTLCEGGPVRGAGSTCQAAAREGWRGQAGEGQGGLVGHGAQRQCVGPTRSLWAGKEGGRELGRWGAGLPARYEPRGQGVGWLFLHQLRAGDIAIVPLSKEAS